MDRASASARPHRDRFPTRGVSALEGLSDFEALERLLSRTLRARAEASADLLLRRFGTLQAVLGGDYAVLRSLVGARTADDLRLVFDAARRLAAAELPRRAVISSWSALSAYLKLTMAYMPREAFRVLFLDKRLHLILDEVMHEGTVDHAPVYPREVMRRALEVSASALILCHNHPSGDPTPSAADIDMTRQVVEAGRALRVSVHDHVVVGYDGIASFKALGLI